MRKTYLTETALGVVAALMMTTSANAGFLNDLGQFISTFGTAHEQDGYRDTGCDPEFQVQITNDAGEYLYSNNPTCPMVGGPSDDLSPTPVVEAPEEEDPEEEDPTDPGEGECKGDCGETPADPEPAPVDPKA